MSDLGLSAMVVVILVVWGSTWLCLGGSACSCRYDQQVTSTLPSYISQGCQVGCKETYNLHTKHLVSFSRGASIYTGLARA